MGGSLLGNGGAGFDGADSTFTGVAFLDSFFNGNGDDGILFDTSTIRAGTVTFDDGMPEMVTTGFTLRNSPAAGKTGDGAFFFDSNVTNFAIQSSHLGEVLDAMGNLLFVGNQASGFEA